MNEMQRDILDVSKQAELCYQDSLKVIADAKQKLFDVTKWIVTLQSLILAASFSKEVNFSPFITVLPVFVGLMGLVLNRAISFELQVHRQTLANLRSCLAKENLVKSMVFRRGLNPWAIRVI
jgi:hypothetical protein